MTMNSLEKYAYDNFNCMPGPSCAYFEIPQRESEDVRVTYVAYAALGSGRNKVEAWLLENVLVPLKKRAGSGARLYWRQSIELTEVSPSRWRVYTRLAVLDKDLEPVVIDDMVKPEGEPCKDLDNE